jgi:hypothetical protein
MRVGPRATAVPSARREPSHRSETPIWHGCAARLESVVRRLALRGPGLPVEDWTIPLVTITFAVPFIERTQCDT